MSSRFYGHDLRCRIYSFLAETLEIDGDRRFSLSIAMVLGVIAMSLTNTFLILAPAAADPNRLAMIYAHWPQKAIGKISYPDYKYFRLCFVRQRSTRWFCARPS